MQNLNNSLFRLSNIEHNNKSRVLKKKDFRQFFGINSKFDLLIYFAWNHLTVGEHFNLKKYFT